jgi:hypothetical protein
MHIFYTKSLLKVKCTFAFGAGHDAERWPSQRSEDRHRKANAGANDISYLKLIKYTTVLSSSIRALDIF